MNLYEAIEQMLRKRPKAREAWREMTSGERQGIVRGLENVIPVELRTREYLRNFASDVAARVEAGR